MNIKEQLIKRSNNKCELCTSSENLIEYKVTPDSDSIDKSILLCDNCNTQITDSTKIEPNHWHCLNETMWSEIPAIQVMAYRVLTKISSEGWASDMLDMLYLENNVKAWAEEGIEDESEKSVVIKDSNGQTLNEGDSITIIKDLDVKGAGFTAKRGTLVKNIHLCSVEGHIEGRVNGVKIYLKASFLKKV